MFVTISGSSADQYTNSGTVPQPSPAVPFTSTAAAAIASNRRIVLAQPTLGSGASQPQTLDERFRALSAQRSQAVRREETKSRQAEARQATLAAQRRSSQSTAQPAKKEQPAAKPAAAKNQPVKGSSSKGLANGKAAGQSKKANVPVKSRLTFPGGSVKSRLTLPGGAPAVAPVPLSGLPTVFRMGRGGGVGLLPPPSVTNFAMPVLGTARGVLRRSGRNQISNANVASAVFGLGTRGAGRPTAVRRGVVAARGGAGRGAGRGGNRGRGRQGGRSANVSATDLDADLDNYMLQAHAEG